MGTAEWKPRGKNLPQGDSLECEKSPRKTGECSGAVEREGVWMDDRDWQKETSLPAHPHQVPERD